MKPISIVQVAACGYGAFYLDTLFNTSITKNYPDFTIAGIVDPYADKSPHYDTILSKGIPIFNTIDEFYENNNADLAFIASPIHLHKPQVETAIKHGSHVLCEKPLAATTQDVVYLEKIASEHDRFLAVGFQWSFCTPIQRLKEDIQAGVYGKPIQFKTLVNWPRDWAYFNRNNWAGKLRLSGDCGEPIWILDSIMNNATAHYLHNMLYILGKKKNESITPEIIEAELYRANDIENYDTCALRAKCGDTEILYLGSHAENNVHETVFTYSFEKAVVEYHDKKSRSLIARFNDGRIIDYGEPEVYTAEKIPLCMEAVLKGGSCGSNDLACVAGTVYPHALCVSIVSDNVSVVNFPDELRVKDEQNKITYVPDLHNVLRNCYANGIMPHEAGISWATKPKKILCDEKKDYIFRGIFA